MHKQTAVGFDYGTSNCTISQVQNGKAVQIPLSGQDLYIPSTLSAPSPEVVSEYLYRHFNIMPFDDIGKNVLSRAIRLNQNEGFDVLDSDLKFGNAALNEYLADPKEVYYAKSPKSFLGITGLSEQQISFFEDLVCAMMTNVKRQAEHSLQAEITQTMIGRPINFGGSARASNEQAENILRRAALRAGFKDIAFQFEPVAAGLEYEASLDSEQDVLVVDIGGGTTDCSMIQMGKQWANKMERSETLLGHSGSRVGGNDLDIFIAFRSFMHEFGMNSYRKSGLPVPITQFWNPLAINDVQAQKAFYARDNLIELNRILKDSLCAQQISRLIEVQTNNLGFSLIKSAESAKIALGEAQSFNAILNLKSEQITVPMLSQSLEQAIENPIEKIKSVIVEVLKQSQVKPDCIFFTGGSSKSPLLHKTLQSVVPNTPIVSGNNFGSVSLGLARWAQIYFK